MLQRKPDSAFCGGGLRSTQPVISGRRSCAAASPTHHRFDGGVERPSLFLSGSSVAKFREQRSARKSAQRGQRCAVGDPMIKE
jgi:hypothetical protein